MGFSDSLSGNKTWISAGIAGWVILIAVWVGAFVVLKLETAVIVAVAASFAVTAAMVALRLVLTSDTPAAGAPGAPGARPQDAAPGAAPGTAPVLTTPGPAEGKTCTELCEHLSAVMRGQDASAEADWQADDRIGGGREDHHDQVYFLEMGVRAARHDGVIALIAEMKLAEAAGDHDRCVEIYHEAAAILS